MGDEKHKKELLSWPSEQSVVSLVNIGKWHKEKIYNVLPDKPELKRAGMIEVVKGWLPDSPLIRADTRVLAVGSCFAQHFTLWLAEHGFNRTFPNSPYNALLRFGSQFESAAVIAQQFRWIFDELDPATLLWIDKNRQIIAATEEGKKEGRATLEQTDVLILTLGLSEVWYDKVSGEPLWRVLTENTFDPQRHVFRVETTAATIESLHIIENLRCKYLPNLKIVFTLSPIPLKTTSRPTSAITANCASKAILRAALDEFLQSHSALLNKHLFYFPSYELVTEYFVDPFQEDRRHLVPMVPNMIISFFAKHYCDVSVALPHQPDSLLDLPDGKNWERAIGDVTIVSDDPTIHELLARISQLEEDIVELRKICEQKERVILELDEAARDRLKVINELQTALDRYKESQAKDA